MKKRMIIMLVLIGIVLANIVGYQFIEQMMTQKFLTKLSSTPSTASAASVTYQEWDSLLQATGSLRAVQGIEITSEVSGIIEKIMFTPGQEVKTGDIILQINADVENAQLHSLQALAELAKVTYKRDKAQFAVHAVSKETVDSDEANLKNQNAQVAQQLAVVEKKTIRAPFSGKLGISQVYLGEFIDHTIPIVSLQQLDPIFADFYIPEQQLQNISLGQEVIITSDSYPKSTFTGKITTINPIVDANTRNVLIEATIPNPKEELLPGMFARVQVTIGKPQRLLTLPQSAISYNPYGSIVYLVQEDGKDAQGNPLLIAQQKFVELGQTRGDQVEVVRGIKEDDFVITSGQLKLKNGSPIIINNSVVPTNEAHPNLVDQ